ncbi:hypothetical protein MTR67_053076 [Solanum verrucosum]|uniref:Uncharacterized protein n=1 Tax=Solanum verrucosum TaxID=315347 RepID=A0AAF0VA21_SOLVR|nr:hypothetical protein MTR67_053076 [Solanum verrucosum]
MNNLVINKTQIVKAREESIRKMEQKNEDKKIKLLYNEVGEEKNIYELDVVELKGLINLSYLFLRRLKLMKGRTNFMNMIHQ